MLHQFTTIIPFEIEAQVAKMKTWHDAHGLPIHTLNHSRETALIKPHLPEWIIPVERCFARGYGRDYLPFAQLLAVSEQITSDPEERILLVNSDISLEEPEVLGELDDPTVDLVFASRLDVTEAGATEDRYDKGYDVFSLKRSAISVLDMPEFYMGIPWWDYILPLSAVSQGYRVRRLDTEAFHHVKHPQRWSLVSFDHIGWNCMQRLLPEDLRRGAPSHERVLTFAQVTNRFLNGPELINGASLPPQHVRAEFMKQIRAKPGIGPEDGSVVAKVTEANLPDPEPPVASPAFPGLLDQLGTLPAGEPFSARAGHHDMGPDIWLSSDPAGEAEFAWAPEGASWRIGLSKGSSGAWACLGMRLPKQPLTGKSYLGLLIEMAAQAPVTFTPKLRYYLPGGIVDVPTSSPVRLAAGPHVHLAHIPIDEANLAETEGCELNLFFEQGELEMQVFKLEPLVLY